MVDFKQLLKENMPTVREMVAAMPVRAIQLYGPTENNIDEFERFVDEVIAPVGISRSCFTTNSSTDRTRKS